MTRTYRVIQGWFTGPRLHAVGDRMRLAGNVGRLLVARGLVVLVEDDDGKPKSKGKAVQT